MADDRSVTTERNSVVPAQFFAEGASHIAHGAEQLGRGAAKHIGGAAKHIGGAAHNVGDVVGDAAQVLVKNLGAPVDQLSHLLAGLNRQDGAFSRWMTRTLQRTVLKPHYYLRRQLFLSFGTSAFLAISFFIVIGIVTATISGESVMKEAELVQKALATYTLGTSARYVAETMTKKFHNFQTASDILMEATRDRIVGYKSADFSVKEQVPFVDYYTQERIYPLDTPDLIRLEWNSTTNIHSPKDGEIHMQGRQKWFDPDRQVSTAYAAYFSPKICDPNAVKGDPGYYEGCTEANNDLNPSETNPDSWTIFNRAKDLAFLLKALYESHPVVKQIGIYFASGGAGSHITFPAYIRDGNQNFTSIGCEWGLNINPLTNHQFLDNQERSRCHKQPGNYPSREFNSLERPWCMRQAMAPPGQPTSTGPYLDASSSRAEDMWVLTFGHGVFDRLTKEFIGCTLVDVSVDDLDSSLDHFIIGSTSTIALIRWDAEESSKSRAGAVVACGQCHMDENRNELHHITQLGGDFGIDVPKFQEMRELVNYDEAWDPVEVQKLYNQTLWTTNERLVMMYPVPYLPNQYEPGYHPEFMVLVSIAQKEIYGDSEDMNEAILADIRSAFLWLSVVGMVGLAIILAFLTWISWTLTKPLFWMKETTAQVITNAGNENLVAGISASGPAVGTSAGVAQCSPKTEVTVLLSEFEMMMDGFSGKGAAEIAGSKVSEVENKFKWNEAYQVLYPYNFRTGGPGEETGDDNVHEGAVIDLMSVKTEMTLMSALTILSEYSVVQAITKPYQDITTSLSKSVSNFATASVTAGIEKLPGWAQKMISGDEDSDDMPDYVVSPPFVNREKNLLHSPREDDIRKKSIEVASSSRVFLWMSFGIQIPLLLTASAVIVLCELWIRANLVQWLKDVRTSSFLLEQDAIVTVTLARAVFGQEVMARPMRDLHVYSRTAGWLLFGAVRRSSALPKMRSGAEECKNYPEVGDPVCPFVKNDVPCACDWNDNLAGAGACTEYPKYGLNSSRFVQSSTMEGQRLDIDPLSGNRPPRPNRTVVYDNPKNTLWWDDELEKMPGSQREELASGFETTYDRVRVLSAMATIEFPLYNYFPGTDEEVHSGSFIGINADGMMIGFSGCSGTHYQYPHWQSTSKNKAYTIAPLLCPNNTFGYDCRCRGWFAEAALGGTYISPPYTFAGSGGAIIGTTASSSIRDTTTLDLIAVAGIDFLPEAFLNALGPDRTIIGDGTTGFAFVITPNDDVNGGNTIFGPNYNLSQGAKAIEDVALPNDEIATANRLNFKATIKMMKQGMTGNTTFTRTKNGEEQTIFLSFAPVQLDVWRPLNHSDFSAGCMSQKKLVYSLGVALDEKDLYIRYEGVEARVDQQLSIARGISIAAMVLISLFVIMLTYYISLNITRPIIALTMIVKSIKNKSLRDEIPDVQGGSREVSFVHQSFQRLMKVVRFANTAFFAGDRTQAYHSMEDALSLFLKLGNQKAIGVASNNLGTMVLQEQMESHGTGRLFDNSLFGVCISEIYNVGITYFDEAIRHGSFEYEISKETEDEGSYAKQLANRFFNRGMFLVVVRNHPLCPTWIHEDGVSDLLRAKHLDLEVLQFLHKHDLFEENEVHEFESLQRRTRGILSLIRNYGFQDPWGIDSLIEQAQTLLNEANDVTSNLFRSMSRVARTQQLDDLRIQNSLCKGDRLAAGKIAMRMLVEDQYIIDTIIVNALTAVKRYYETEGIRIPRINATQYLQRETRKAQVNVLREAKNVFFCLDYSGSMAGERMERAQKNLLWVYEEHCSDKDMVGFIRFNHDIDEKLWFPLGKKGDWGQVQEAVLKLATDAEGGTRLYAALNRCVTQILQTETKNDTWIIALTDGESSWDHPAKSVVERIKKWNKKRKAKIHVIIIGFEVPESVIKTCHGVTSVTDKSVYVDARGGLDEMDKAFEQVVSVIGGSAITMETF